MIDALKTELASPDYAEALKAATGALKPFPLKPGDPNGRALHDAAVAALDALAQQVNAKLVSTDTPEKVAARGTYKAIITAGMNDKYAALAAAAPADVLLAAGLISAEQHAAQLDLEPGEAPFWQTIGGREVDHGDIIAALGRDWGDLSVSEAAP